MKMGTKWSMDVLQLVRTESGIRPSRAKVSLKAQSAVATPIVGLLNELHGPNDS
jgi:hypothetical protein